MTGSPALIADAAIRVMVNKGLDALSVRNVAAEAGVAPGTVQYQMGVKGQNVCLGLVFSAVLARVSADIYGCWAYIGGVSVHSSVWCP
ncbi:TetR/AcrR family transcriptional regulator [Pseudoglutamicibacter albus]|uniref:TetR/AcrR family transcriptional regulator n=1 Tax=Pseudoglutamicibacter albus TaxID=98671 RepID=UPI00286D5BA3|nr:TetR/AcrR family transcriptional regulator [Pseudoglutamicibacter albus]